MSACKTLRALALSAGLTITMQAGAETVKIAFIDPLSGSFTNVGENQLKIFQFVADRMNASKKAGANVQFEIVPFDSKASPQESLTVLKRAIDEGIRYVTLGASGSGAALALSDAIAKHNEREPSRPVLFLNYGAIDPTLTNEKCNFWHFSFDANTSMKMEALTTYLATNREVKKVYLINQNYAHGHQVARYAKELLARKRPDAAIVGDDLHPIGQVKDFAPYVAKIKTSGADTVITGNWGNDLALLIKAAKENNVAAKFYTYYGDLVGAPGAFGAAGEGRVHTVGNWTRNSDKSAIEPLAADFKAKYGQDFGRASIYSTLNFLAAAMAKAKSTDPLAVANSLEGLKVAGPAGEEEMRGADHQVQQAVMITTFSRADGKRVKHDLEGTGYGFVSEVTFEPHVAAQPTSCRMTRPAK